MTRAAASGGKVEVVAINDPFIDLDYMVRGLALLAVSERETSYSKLGCVVNFEDAVVKYGRA